MKKRDLLVKKYPSRKIATYLLKEGFEVKGAVFEKEMQSDK